MREGIDEKGGEVVVGPGVDAEVKLGRANKRVKLRTIGGGMRQDGFRGGEKRNSGVENE